MDQNNFQPGKSKYEEALSKYVTDMDDAKVAEAVKKIIAEKVPENDNLDVKKFLMGSIELTTLKTTDSEESVLAFTEKVNQFDEAYPALPHVATICVYPNPASSQLTVAGIPTGSRIEVFNALGCCQLVASQSSFSISALPTGVYLLKMHLPDGQILHHKIIKQ
jgi:hypothetical protein